MRKGITLVLGDEEIQDLYRIILDDDQAAALRFVKEHLRRPVVGALEGG